MRVDIPDIGSYIVAVSGGVDSVVLLDILANQSGANFVVAHFDHGIRDDSGKDAEFVKNLADKYCMRYEVKRVELGARASEAEAREARYMFLRHVKQKYNAMSIITAHHQDDLIETALLNTLRGTKRKGLVSLKNRPDIFRPLLETAKQDILRYAEEHNLEWREDSTNTDLKYARNKIRSQINDGLTSEKRERIISLLHVVQEENKIIDEAISTIIKAQPKQAIAKDLLTQGGLAEAYEIAAGWLRSNNVVFDRQTLQRLVVGARTMQNAAKIDLKDRYYAVIKRNVIAIERR